MNKAEAIYNEQLTDEFLLIFRFNIKKGALLKKSGNFHKSLDFLEESLLKIEEKIEKSTDENIKKKL